MSQTDEDAKFCPHCHTRLDRKTDPVLPAEHFDNDQHAIIVNGDRRRLTPHQWRLLLIFWERQDRVLSKDVLFALLYDDKPNELPEPKTLDVYICHLRAALRGSPFMIETTFAEGYLFTAKRPAKIKPKIEFGAAEDGVPLPRFRARPPGIVEHLKKLQPGQSMVIRNTTTHSIQSVTKVAGLANDFVRAETADGAVRVWRKP
jgi:DNA-binding winged helix-turn-helix (wHTH) protein